MAVRSGKQGIDCLFDAMPGSGGGVSRRLYIRGKLRDTLLSKHVCLLGSEKFQYCEQRTYWDFNFKKERGVELILAR